MKSLKMLRSRFLSAIKYLVTGRKGLNEADVERKLAEVKVMLAGTVRNVLVERRPTHCPKLWDSIFVDQYGNVFACCYSRPGSVGNLYRSNVHAIWQRSRRLKLFRWLSRHNALFCALHCDLLSDEEKEAPVAGGPRPEHPATVRILHGELCNLACSMCWQNHRDRRAIDNAVLQEQIDWPAVTEIELQGGEVLAMKQAKDFFLWLTQAMGKKVSLITNGTLLSEDWARHLVLGADWIQVSVNAASKEVHEQVNRGSRFERVTANIGRLVQRKRELGSEVRIIYKFTIVPQNVHEIGDAIGVAAALGCAKIAFGFDTATIPAYLREHPHVKREVSASIRAAMAAGPAIEVETLRLERLGLLDPVGQGIP